MTRTDDAFERRLRDGLSARAAVEPSLALRARIADVPATSNAVRRRWHALVAPLAATVAVTAVAIAAIALGSGLGRSAGPGVVGAPSTPATGLQPGDGLLTAPPEFPLYSIAGLVLVVAVAGVLAIGWRLRSRVARLAYGLILVAVVGMVAPASVIRSSSRSGRVGPRDWPGSSRVPTSRPEGVYRPGPGGRFTFGLAVANHGPVAITVRGLVRPDEACQVAFVGLGTAGTPGADVTHDAASMETDPAKLVPATAVIIGAWAGAPR